MSWNREYGRLLCKMTNGTLQQNIRLGTIFPATAKYSAALLAILAARYVSNDLDTRCLK